MKTNNSDEINKYEKDLDDLAGELLNTYTEINLLYRVSEKLGSVTDIDEIAKITLDEIYKQIQSSRASIMLFDEKKKTLRIIHSRGLPPEFKKNVIIPLEESVVEDVIIKGKPLLINNLNNHERLSKKLKGGNYQSRSMLSVPLLVIPNGSESERLGVINLSDRLGGRGYFTSNDQKLVLAVASQASVALKKVFLMNELKQSHEETKEAFLYTIQSLARAAEANDEDTGNHIIRVGKFARVLSQALGQPESFCEGIFYFAQMHDVGKVHIHPDILRKPGRLTEEEFATVKDHCKSGSDIIGSASKLSMSSEIAFTHHERWDGSGYPKRLKGKNIPVSGRITSVADIYDALRSKRNYKPAFDHETTFKIMTEGDGRTMPDHFDPVILEAFKGNHQKFEMIYDQLKDKEG